MTAVSTGGRLCFPSGRPAVPRQSPGPKVRRVSDALTRKVVHEGPERGGRAYALDPAVPAVENDEGYRAMCRPDHLANVPGG